MALTPQAVSRALRKANVNIAPANLNGLHASKAVLGQVCITADHDLDRMAARASKVAEDAARTLGYTVDRIDPAIFYVSEAAPVEEPADEPEVDHHGRDPQDMTGHCQAGNHDECEDYPDVTCVCTCHDHWGVPVEYRTDSQAGA